MQTSYILMSLYSILIYYGSILAFLGAEVVQRGGKVLAAEVSCVSCLKESIGRQCTQPPSGQGYLLKGTLLVISLTPCSSKEDCP